MQTPHPPNAKIAAGPSKAYRTTPYDTPGMPPGVPYIIGNEAAERFSYYGMLAILAVFMSKHLLDSSGAPAGFSEAEAREWIHYFAAGVYMTPILGAVLADWLWGKYATIMRLSLVYCLGHGILALMDQPLGVEPKWVLLAGLGVIALGAGGIKPCVSAHVGDQFSSANERLLPKVYSWFYFSINAGSAVSTLLTPWLLERYGPGVAFGTPGVLMAIATLVFWMGRRKYAHIPPAGSRFLQEALGPQGRGALLALAPLFLLVLMFFALFDQTHSAWVLQAEKMDRVLYDGVLFGEPRKIEVLASQLQTLNPFMVLVLIPLFSYALYPAMDRVAPMTPLRKIGLGMVLTCVAFAIPSCVEGWIVAGATPSILWQVLAYLLLTAAEVMVSITALEFSYTQSPRGLKSIVMACYMLSIALGNLFTALVNTAIRSSEGELLLQGASYYWFFTLMMVATTVLYMAWAPFYRGKTYLQV